MRKTNRQELGKWGETIAANYLVGKGFAILARNVRTPYGEIDLVARKDNLPVSELHLSSVRMPADPVETAPLIVFIEVRTRTTQEFGLPEESIMEAKRSHILAAVQFYLQEHPELEGDWRVDVIAIFRPTSTRHPDIKHFEGALEV